MRKNFDLAAPRITKGRFEDLYRVVCMSDCIGVHEGMPESQSEVSLSRPALAAYLGRECGVPRALKILKATPRAFNYSFRFRTLEDGFRFYDRVKTMTMEHSIKRRSSTNHHFAVDFGLIYGNLPRTAPKPIKPAALDPESATADASLEDEC